MLAIEGAARKWKEDRNSGNLSTLGKTCQVYCTSVGRGSGGNAASESTLPGRQNREKFAAGTASLVKAITLLPV